MLTLLSELTCWHWMIFGIALIATEMIFPSALIFLWSGLAALMIGVAITFVPHLIPLYQAGIWLILSYLFIIQWIEYCKINPLQPALRRPAQLPEQEYIGQQFILTKPIINGHGEITLGEKIFLLLAIDDYPAGTLVKISRVEGDALRIQQVI